MQGLALAQGIFRPSWGEEGTRRIWVESSWWALSSTWSFPGQSDMCAFRNRDSMSSL